MRLLLLSLVSLIAYGSAALPATPADAEELRDGWQVSSSCNAPPAGEAVSLQSYEPKGWYTASVPATVLAVQLQNHALADADIFYGTNLRKLAGMSYPIGTFFSNQDMPADSPYACGWWYRRSFTAARESGRRAWLHFAGINYRANVWVNGVRIADTTEVAGAYRTYDFDVTDRLSPSGKNVIAVETFAPNADDLGINWVDWNPCPPDKDMGLWGGVSLTTTGAVTLRSPLVSTHFDNDSLHSAALQITVELANHTDTPVTGVLRGFIDGLAHPVSVQAQVTLEPHEDRSLSMTPDSYPQLRLQNPPVWWPVDWGAHPLEKLQVTFSVGAQVSDAASIRFGIREMNSQLDASNHLLFRVNRKPILIRGGGWSPDMLLRASSERMRQEFALVDDLHLNTIRLEGKLETDEFFDLADEHGVLVMAGWCCCDHWEHWTKWKERDEAIATASLRAQLLRIRHHASLLVWLNGSDGPPPEKIERAYLEVERQTQWPNAILSSAAANPTVPTGPSGVKMLGPYDYVVPSYWLRDTEKAGGAYGFNSETSPGPAIPSILELKQFLPPDQLWPINSTWDFHAGGGKYKNLAVMNTAVDRIYGTTGDLVTYTRTAQTMAYDSERAMFEAYARNKYQSTGVIQWMLNNAWPSLIWHLYDYYLQPGAGYYGTKKACEPLHAQYSYDDDSVVVVNSTQTLSEPLVILTEAFDLNSKLIYARHASLRVGPDSSSRIFAVPSKTFAASPVIFLRLQLQSADGKLLSQNFYWVPTKKTLFDWPNTDYTHTPPATFEDLSMLRSLPRVTVEAELVSGSSAVGESGLLVRIRNTSKTLAFQLSLEATTAAGTPYRPLMWSDNFISLLPGETREIRATSLDRNQEADSNPVVRLSGWNVDDVVMTAHRHSPPLRPVERHRHAPSSK